MPWLGWPSRAGNSQWTQVFRDVAIPAGVTSVVLDISWLDPLRVGQAEGDVWIDDIYFGPPP